mgnify:CR=1 FL=1
MQIVSHVENQIASQNSWSYTTITFGNFVNIEKILLLLSYFSYKQEYEILMSYINVTCISLLMKKYRSQQQCSVKLRMKNFLYVSLAQSL